MNKYSVSVAAKTTLVTKDADEVYSYFANLEDAIVSALAMVERRGWTLYGHQRDRFTVAEAERIQAYMRERGYDTTRTVSAMVFMPEVDEDGNVTGWADADQHMGAIYASEL